MYTKLYTCFFHEAIHTLHAHSVHGSQHQYVGLQKQLRVMENRLEKVTHTHTLIHSHTHTNYFQLMHTKNETLIQSDSTYY